MDYVITLAYRIIITCFLFDSFLKFFYSIHIFSYLIQNFHQYFLFHTYFFLFDSKFPPILFNSIHVFFSIWFKNSTHTFYSIHIFLFDLKFPPILFIPSIFFLNWFKNSTHTFYSIDVFPYLIQKEAKNFFVSLAVFQYSLIFFQWSPKFFLWLHNNH